MLRIYYAELTGLAAELGELPLSELRRGMLSSCRSESRRRQSIAGELLLIHALRALGQEPALPLPISLAEKGKPFLPGSSLHFSVSHSGNAAACALSDGPVGLDLERVRPLNSKLLSRCFSSPEREEILRSSEPEEAFTRLWTRKESYLKATGEGIRSSLSALDTSVPDPSRSFFTVRIGSYVLTVCRLDGDARPDCLEAVDLSRVIESEIRT